MILLSIITLEIIAIIIVIVLLFLSITIHYVPNEFIWITKNKKSTYKVLKPGIRFIFPFVNRIVAKLLTSEQKGEIYLNDVKTKDGDLEVFKIDYSYEISCDYFSYEFDLSQTIIDSINTHINLIDKKTLLHESSIISDKIYFDIKEEVEKNGYLITKITIFHEK